MQLTEIVAHHQLVTTKPAGKFVYEIILEKHTISGLYRISRRWAYLDQFDKFPIKTGDWHLKFKDQFKRKVRQKLDIMGYKQLETFTQKVLEE